MYNIFIDTNVFGKKDNYNFNSGMTQKIISLLSKNEKVKVYITDMVLEELKKHIKEFIDDDKRRPKSNYLKKYIPKNFYENIYKKNCAEINRFVEENDIEVIKTSDYCDIKDINLWYFNTIFPFENKVNKKDEFPDAIIVSTIEKYIINNKIHNIYIVSDDKGLCKAISQLLKSKVKIISDIKIVATEILGFNPTIIEIANTYFYKTISKNSIIIKLLSNDDTDILDIDEIVASHVDSQIIELHDDVYTTIIEFDAIVTGEFSVLNPYSSVYDREDPECSYIEYRYSDKLSLKKQAIIVDLAIKDENIVSYKLYDESKNNIYDYLDQMQILGYE